MTRILAISTCLAALAACDVMGAPDVGELGEPCSSQGTCRGDLGCDRRSFTCERAGGLDAPCSSAGTCSGDLLCDASSNLCVQWGHEYQPCSRWGECLDDLVCGSNDLCVPWGNLGGPCSASGACKGALICTGARVCVECTSNSHCGIGESCSSGRCTTPCQPYCKSDSTLMKCVNNQHQSFVCKQSLCTWPATAYCNSATANCGCRKH